MGSPPRPFSENMSPIPSGASPHRGFPGQGRSLGYGGVSTYSEVVQRMAGESARVFDDILGRIQGVASDLVGELDDPAPRAELQAIVRACHQGADVAQKLGAISLRERQSTIVLDLADFIPSLDLGNAVPEEVLYYEDFPEIPCRVTADPGQMEQALHALVSNAVDALKDADPGTPGVIWVGLQRIGGRAKSGDQRVRWLHLQVADNGCGMDPATASRAFAPFFTTKTDPPGLGLGLAMAEGFIRQAGGTIALESAPGWGTRVNVWLPVSGPGDPRKHIRRGTDRRKDR